MPRLLLLALALLLGAAPAHAAGFSRHEVTDPAGGLLEVALWYPSDTPPSPQPLGPHVQPVAPGAPMRGEALPLVLMSHGSGGSLSNHYDTALALAEAGFIVAALTHRGDSTDDASLAGTSAGLVLRSLQYKRVMDWLLGEWAGRGQVDAGRLAGFGFAAGGFTVLVAAGGVPDLSRIGLHCTTQPGDPSCRLVRTEGPQPQSPAEWVHDGRLRALVLATPALGYTFMPLGLATVDLPVQLWRGRQDEVLMHPWHAEQVRYALPNAPLHAEVPGAGHYAFLAPCPPPMMMSVPEICMDPQGFDRARFHREFNAVVVRFLQEKLR